MKPTLTTWLVALCALLLAASLALQFKQKNELETLRTEHQAFVSATEQQTKETASTISKLAEQGANTTVAVQQQTSVLDRAIGKVIPVTLPDWFTNQIADLETQIQHIVVMPTDAEITNMYGTLTNLVERMPAWAENDYLPQLNKLRWAVQSLQVLQVNASASGETLNDAAEAYANQLSIQPDDASTNIAAILTGWQQDATNRFATYRRNSAIAAAANQLSLAVMGDGLAAWQRLSEWTNDPAVAQLRRQLHSRLLEDSVDDFIANDKSNLQKLDGLTNDILWRAGYAQALEIYGATTGRMSNREFVTAQSAIVGGGLGAWGGASAGATIGAGIGVWFGGAGAAPGAAIGGLIGGRAGGFGGAALGEVAATGYYGRLDQRQKEQVETFIYQHYGVRQ